MQNKYFFLIFLLIIPNFLFATDWADVYPLHIYGDVSYIAQVFEFVNEFIDNPGVEKIVQLGVSITFVLAGLKLKDGDLTGFGTSVIAPITLLALFFTPTVQVKIVDLRVDKGYIDHTLSPDGGYQEVDNVPWAIAFLPASAMMITNLTIDIIDSSWASTHIANKFSSIGFQELSIATRGALAMKSFVSSSDSNSSRYDYDVNTYMKECVIKKALSYNQNRSYIYAQNKRFPEYLDPANFPHNFGADYIDYVDYDNVTQTNVSCATAYTDLVAAHGTKINEAIEYNIQKLNPTKDFTSAGSSEAFRQLIGATSADSSQIGSLSTAVATTVAGKFFERQQSIDSVGVDGYSIATQLSIDTTLANLRSEGPAKFEWLAQVLPDAIFIIIGIFIGAYPILIVVQSFLGAGAYKNIANYFMGFFALYFNFVGLALVQNIITFYTAQEAQESIVVAQNIPFSIDHISDFLIQQANMTGLAGMIGVATVFAVTPLVFYGESRGFNAAISGVSGMFNGNIEATAKDTLARDAIQASEDERTITENDASQWLSQNGWNDFRRHNASSLATMNQILQGSAQVGAGLTAKDILHSGNVPDYIQGNYAQTTQQAMKTVGMGSSIDSIQSVSDVAMQDGQVMAESINATSELRGKHGYDTENIGSGMAMQQYAKDMGADYIGSQGVGAVGNLVANAVNQSVQQLASGKGLIESGAFKEDGSFNKGNSQANLLETGYQNQARIQANKTMGIGKELLTADDMNNIQYGSQAGIQSEIGKGKASKEVLQENSDYYKEAGHWGETAQISQTKGSMEAYDNNAKEMAQVVQDDSFIKANAQKGSVDAQMDEYIDKMAKSGKSLAETIEGINRSLSGAKTASDIRNIETAGGEDEYIDFSRNQASLKTAQGMASVKAAKEAEFLDDNGITQEGMEAYGIQAGEQASILGVKRDLFFGKDSKDFIQKLRDKMKGAGVAAHIADGKTSDEANKIMESAFDSAGFTNEADGQDAINALAKMGAMNYASSKTISAGGVQFNMGIGADGNTRIGQATTTQSFEGGMKIDTNAEGRILEEVARLKLGDGATDEQVAQKATSLGRDKHLIGEVRKNYADYLAMGAGDAAKSLLNNVFNVNTDGEMTSLGINAASLGATALVLDEGAERIKHKIDGKYIAKEGFSYQTGVTVTPDGAELPVMKQVKAGQEVSINGNPELKEYFDANRDNFKLKGGVPSRVLGAALEGTGDLFNSISPFSKSKETLDSTNNSSDNSQNPQDTQGTKPNEQQGTQSTPPNKDNESITQNSELDKKSGNLQDLKESTTKSYEKTRDSMSQQYLDEFKSAKGADKAEVNKKWTEKIQALDNRYNETMSAIDNGTYKVDDIPQVKDTPQIKDIPNDNIDTKPIPHKDHGKLTTSIKGGGIGTLISAAGMVFNDLAHGKDWNHTLKETGSALYTSYQTEGIMGTARDIMYGGKENRMLIENADKKEGNFVKTAALMGTSVVEGIAEFGGSALTVANNYSRAAANTLFSNSKSSFTQNLLAQEKDDNNNNFNFTRDLNNFWNGSGNSAPQTVVAPPPNQPINYMSNPGATSSDFRFVDNNVTYQSASGSYANPFASGGGNYNPFATDNVKLMTDNGEDNRSYIMGIDSNIESLTEQLTEQQEEIMMNLIKDDIKNGRL